MWQSLLALGIASVVVAAALLTLLRRGGTRDNRPPYALVALADRYGLDVQGRRVAGRIGRQFVHLELTDAAVGFGYRRHRTVQIRVQGPRVTGLQIRPCRGTDLRPGVEVDLGRFDEHVRVTATDPADAVSRFTSAARGACLRAIGLGATYDAGTWALNVDAGSERAAQLLGPVLAAAEGVDATGSVEARLEHNAAHDPILEVRVVNAAHRLDRGPADDTTVRRLASVLVEGCKATPPVVRAAQAMETLRASRAHVEVGRISLASDTGGQVALADARGGQVSLPDDEDSTLR